jgi:hypothetical protein
VIVIDKGRLIYDGELKELVHRIRPRSASPSACRARRSPQLEKLVRRPAAAADAQVVLTVPVARVSEVLRAALGTLSVLDLAVRTRRSRRSCASCSRPAPAQRPPPEARREDAGGARRPGLPHAVAGGPGRDDRLPAEFIIWILTTNMPLVMMALWTAVAAEGPSGGSTRRPSRPTTWPR